MSWLATLDKDLLQRLNQRSQCCLIATGLDGEIYWASDQFCEWSGYTETELKKLGWITISKQDESLEADKQSAEEMRLGTRIAYTVQKAYIKKSGTPQWGVLAVQRIPEIGEVKFAWCHWTPIDGASDTAFSLAMEYQQKLELRITDMTTTIKALTNQSDEDRAVSSIIKMVVKYPKLFLAVTMLIAGSQGANLIVETMQKLGWINPPKTEIIVPKGATIPDLRNTEGLALRRVSENQASIIEYSVSLSSGNQVSWRSKNAGPMPDIYRRGGAIGGRGSASGTVYFGSPVAGSDELPNGKFNEDDSGGKRTESNGSQAW